MLEKIYTEVITEHSQSKKNQRQLKNANKTERGHNPSCGDEITIELEIVDGIIEDAAFNGCGCAISKASTDIMIELIRGKKLDTARRLIELFIKMIQGEISDEFELEELDEALALKNISMMPARVKCATLAWRTLEECLKHEKEAK